MKETLHSQVQQKKSYSFTFITSLLLIFFLLAGGQARTSNQDDPTFQVDVKSSLGATTALIDQYLNHALTSLRLIAAAPTARSGIWPEIRPTLITLQRSIPGAALYIQPDGGYYSVEMGYTGLNLSDRSYFSKLFRGEEIHGDLIYSRSTGKQSAIMAVPIYEAGEVTGAVALSIFLDDLQQLISESLDLPPDYLWYVIDDEANTVLHPRRDFVFMNPVQQGSPSLSRAINYVISQDSGNTSYTFSGRNTQIAFGKLKFNNWRLLIGKFESVVETSYMPAAYETLDHLRESIQSHLNGMDRSLRQMIASFGGQFPREHIARDAFRRFYQDNPYVLSCVIIDPDGTIVYAEPSDFYPSQGESTRHQEQYFLMQKNRAPILSNSFLSVEGYDAVSLQHPILDSRGGIHGSVSVLIRPDVMIEELATPHITETIYEPWVMEPEGRILFEKAFGGTGRMLFLDYRSEGFESLLALGNLLESKTTGQSDYIYIDPKDQQREVRMAIWDTIHLHNTTWRVIVSYTPYEQ